MVSSENNIIIGLQWGHEGKNRLLDFFANRSEVIVRFHGSATGGHQISAGGERFTLEDVYKRQTLCLSRFGGDFTRAFSSAGRYR